MCHNKSKLTLTYSIMKLKLKADQKKVLVSVLPGGVTNTTQEATKKNFFPKIIKEYNMF